MTSEWPIRSDYQCAWDKSIRRHLPKGNLIQALTRCDHDHPPHLKIRRQQLYSIFNWQKDKKAPQFLEKYCLRAIDYNFGHLRHFSEQFKDTKIILKLQLPFETLNHWHSNWDWHCIENLVWDILLRPSITDIQLKHYNRSREGARNFLQYFQQWLHSGDFTTANTEWKEAKLNWVSKKLFQRDIPGECQQAININWIEEHFRPPGK